MFVVCCAAVTCWCIRTCVLELESCGSSLLQGHFSVVSIYRWFEIQSHSKLGKLWSHIGEDEFLEMKGVGVQHQRPICGIFLDTSLQIIFST